MAKKQVVWTDTAIAELEGILQFYLDRNQNNNYSNWLLLAIEKRIELISMYSQIGRETDLPNIRILPFSDFGIIYMETINLIYIESIWDFRQNPIKRFDNI